MTRPMLVATLFMTVEIGLFALLFMGPRCAGAYHRLIAGDRLRDR